jgi:hypothetical protein
MIKSKMIKNKMIITHKYVEVGRYLIDYLSDPMSEPLKGMSEYSISIDNIINNIRNMTPTGIDIINTLLINNSHFFNKIIKEAKA